MTDRIVVIITGLPLLLKDSSEATMAESAKDRMYAAAVRAVEP